MNRKLGIWTDGNHAPTLEERPDGCSWLRLGNLTILDSVLFANARMANQLGDLTDWKRWTPSIPKRKIRPDIQRRFS